MKKACLIIRGKTATTDQKFRPGSRTPDLHWAHRLIDPFIVYDGSMRPKYPKHVWLDYGDDAKRRGISVMIDSELWKDDEACFDHIMEFVKQNDLEYEFPNNMEACGACEGHINCVSQCHIINIEDIKR